MPDIKCEIFTKVLATLSEPILDLIPGNKNEFLTHYLKPINVEVLAQEDENVVCLVGKLQNINESHSILTKKLLQEEFNLTGEKKIENTITDENIAFQDVHNGFTQLQSEQNNEELLTKHEEEAPTRIAVETNPLDHNFIDDETSFKKGRTTKSGRLVKVPLKLSTDADSTVEQEENANENIDGKRRGRPRKWIIYDENNQDVEFKPKSIMKSSGNLQSDKKDIKKYYEDKLPYKFFCNICSFKSKRHSHFVAHKDLHKRNPNLKLHSCNKCDFTTVRLGVLQRHKMKHISDSKDLYTCKYCDFTTSIKKCLVKHEYKHTKKKYGDYSCNYCDFTTPHKTQFSKHLLKHSNNDSAEVYQCPKCDYQSKRKINYLRHHRDKHSDVRPHLCDLCGAAFKRTDALRAHKESHIEKSRRVLPFVCETCHKGFRTMAHLVEHMPAHSTERSFQCHICGQMFKTKAVQQRHLRGVHHKANVDQCSTCKKFFSSKYTLKRHLRQHEGENLPNDAQIKTIQTLMPEGQQQDFITDQGQIPADEDASAIQTITITSENINDLSQKLQNITGQIQSVGDTGDVYIDGLENVDANTVSIVNLNGEDIGQILIPSSESEYTEHVPQLSVTDTNTQNIDTGQQINTDSVKLFQSLQQGHVMVSSSNLNNDSAMNIELVSIKQELNQLGSEFVTNSELVNQVQNQVEGTKYETVDVTAGQLLDIPGQIISAANDGQIALVVTPDGNTYHVKVNSDNNMLSLENNDQDM